MQVVAENIHAIQVGTFSDLSSFPKFGPMNLRGVFATQVSVLGENSK